LHLLTVGLDDLGGAKTSYLYRCDSQGARPLLSWGWLPGFGVRSLVVAWLAWGATWIVALGLICQIRSQRSRLD
jgi:hypothetical protein